MGEIVVIADAVLPAEPRVVFQSLLDEANGRTDWWMPCVKMVPTSGTGGPGSTFEVHVLKPPRATFTGFVAGLTQNQRFQLRYTHGDFVGTGLWLFEPADGGTRVHFRWRVRPNSLRMKLAAPFSDFDVYARTVLDEGFRGLRRYLEEHRRGKAMSAAGALRTPRPVVSPR